MYTLILLYLVCGSCILSMDFHPQGNGLAYSGADSKVYCINARLDSEGGIDGSHCWNKVKYFGN